MRILMTLLLLGAVFSIVSAITGIQSVHGDSRTGTVITYYSHPYERLLAVAFAALSALAFYGVYRRYPVVWRLGFIALYLSAADFVFHVWWSLWSQPYGWVGATLATVFAPLILLYWLSWWRRQRAYFLS